MRRSASHAWLAAALSTQTLSACTFDPPVADDPAPFIPGVGAGGAGGEGGGPAATGSVEGRVIVRQTSAPLAAATVRVGEIEATTDEEGRFALSDVPAGDHAVTVTVPHDVCAFDADGGTLTVAAGETLSADVPIGGDITVDVLVLSFNPIIESEGGQRVHEIFGWTDPRELNARSLESLDVCSGLTVGHRLVEWIDVDHPPMLLSGETWDDETLLAVLRGEIEPTGEMADYEAIVAEHNLATRVDRGEIDEVVMWGHPWGGFYESRMAGPSPYWVNAPGLYLESERAFIMMGLNYERGVGEAIHSYGHRTESIMTHVYEVWNLNPYLGTTPGARLTAWDRFASHDATMPGSSGCGSVHFPPNALDDYDYDNSSTVTSRCADYLRWPELTDATTTVSNATWSQGDPQRHFLEWWYSHIPRADGTGEDGRQLSWWRYIADFNAYPESR